MRWNERWWGERPERWEHWARWVFCSVVGAAVMVQVARGWGAVLGAWWRAVVS